MCVCVIHRFHYLNRKCLCLPKCICNIFCKVKVLNCSYVVVYYPTLNSHPETPIPQLHTDTEVGSPLCTVLHLAFLNIYNTKILRKLHVHVTYCVWLSLLAWPLCKGILIPLLTEAQGYIWLMLAITFKQCEGSVARLQLFMTKRECKIFFSFDSRAVVLHADFCFCDIMILQKALSASVMPQQARFWYLGGQMCKPWKGVCSDFKNRCTLGETMTRETVAIQI